jgi:hypothetical protein
MRSKSRDLSLDPESKNHLECIEKGYWPKGKGKEAGFGKGYGLGL